MNNNFTKSIINETDEFDGIDVEVEETSLVMKYKLVKYLKQLRKKYQLMLKRQYQLMLREHL
jgi:hypothetical protein